MRERRARAALNYLKKFIFEFGSAPLTTKDAIRTR